VKIYRAMARYSGDRRKCKATLVVYRRESAWGVALCLDSQNSLLFCARTGTTPGFYGGYMSIARGLFFLPLILAGCVQAADPADEVVLPTAPQVDVAPIPDEDNRYTLKVAGLPGQSFSDINSLWTDTIVNVCGNTLINPYALYEVLERDGLGRAIPTLQGTVSCR